MSKIWPFTTPGIPDEHFLRANVPLTKEEIRVLTIAKARLAPHQVVWDIGSGTGSISVEAALLVPGGTVYAIEKNARAQELTRHNAEQFKTFNIVPILGEAPRALYGLPDPHRVIIGGSGGNLTQIFEVAWERLKPGGRIIANTVTIESFIHCANLFDLGNWEVIQVNIARSKPVGNLNMWQSLNPVYIFALEK